MALRFRNLSGNPYAGLASTAESVYGRLGSTYLRQAEDERRRREREDAQYNQMLQSTVGLVAKGMEYDIQQDKIARDNALNRLKLEDSSFNIIAKNLKPSSVNKLVTQRSKFINKIYKDGKADFNENGLYGVEINKSDMRDPSLISAKDTASLASAYEKLAKLNVSRKDQLRNQYGALYGRNIGVDGDPQYRVLTPEEAKQIEEETPGSLPRGWYEDKLGEGNKLMPKAEIPTFEEFLRERKYTEMPKFEVWKRVQLYGTPQDMQQVMGTNQSGSFMLQEEDGKYLATGLTETIDEISGSGETTVAGDSPSYSGVGNFLTREIESLVADNQPKLSPVPTDDKTESANQEVVSLPSDAVQAGDTSMFAMEESTFQGEDAGPKVAGEVTSSEPLAKFDKKKGIFVTPMLTGDVEASKEDVDAQFKANTVQLTDDFIFAYNKQFGGFPPMEIARQQEKFSGIFAEAGKKIRENKAIEMRDKILAEQKEKEKVIDQNNEGFSITDDEVVAKEAEEKEQAETFAITSKLAVKDIESRKDFQGYVYNPDGTKDAIFDNDFIKSPRIAGSYEDEDVFSSLTEFENKYAKYFEQQSDGGLSPAEHKQRAFTNRIVDIYSSATGSDDAKKKFTVDQIQKQATNYKMAQMSGSGQSGLQAGLESKSFGENVRSRALQELERLTKPFPDNPTQLGIKGPKNLLEARIQKKYEEGLDTTPTFGTFSPQEAEFFLESVAEGQGMDEEETANFVSENMAYRSVSQNLTPKQKLLVDKVGQGAERFYARVGSDEKVGNIGTVSPEEMDELVTRASTVYGVDPKILRTIIDSESNRRGHNGKGYDTLYVRKGDQRDGSDSFGIGQFGIGAYRQLENTAGPQGVMWNMIKNGDAKTQVNAVAMYVKNYIQPLLKKYGKDPNSAIEVGMVYKGGYTFDQQGNAKVSDIAKKNRYLKKLAMFLRNVEGRARRLKASD